MGSPGLRLGVDIGGTFTDVALTDVECGRVWVAKRLTTPHDPSVALLDGASEALAAAGSALTDVSDFVHGTTLASNVVLERKGEGIALLTTRGFRDVLLIGRQKRYDIYRLDLRKPAPLLARRDIHEVTERIRADGSIETPLAADELRALARELVAKGVLSLAISFLNSYANAEHELEARRIVQEEASEIVVSISAEVAPQWREYERTSTTVVNAYVAPSVHDYLGRLTARTQEDGLDRGLLVMQSNGGVGAASTARRFPVRLIESGPAAGVIMAAKVGAELGERHVVSFDMGGTTAKLAHVEDGSPRIADTFEVDRIALRPRSGLPISVPAIDLVEIGAGGGSIARVSALGLVTVGPESAGADPGPICYGRGGAEPTVTDADLVLGYLDPGFFAGGAMKLDRDAAYAGIRERIAQPLGLDPIAAAWAIHELVNTNMVAAARTASVERGVDPRRAVLVAFGGAGPVHASRLAAGLGIARVVIPLKAGVASAFGLLAGDVKFDAARTQRLPLETESFPTANDAYAELERSLREMVADAVGPERAEGCRFVHSADMRYVGQGYEIRVLLPGRPLVPEDAPLLAAAFQSEYRALYGRSDGAERVEVVNWRMEARLANEETATGAFSKGVGEALKGTRIAYFPEAGGFGDCNVLDRYLLAPGQKVTGPAVIEERESTTVVLPRQAVEVHQAGHLILSAAEA